MIMQNIHVLHTRQMHVPAFLCQYLHRLFSAMQNGDHPRKRWRGIKWEIKSNSSLSLLAHYNIPVLESVLEENYQALFTGSSFLSFLLSFFLLKIILTSQ